MLKMGTISDTPGCVDLLGKYPWEEKWAAFLTYRPPPPPLSADDSHPVELEVDTEE